MHRAATAVLLAVTTALAGAATATALVRPYTPCEKTGGAILVEVSGATCDEARAVATALAGVPPEGVEAGLLAQGWTPLRANATGYDDSYELFALRGRAGLWIRERGPAPDLDSWTAGRELLFSRDQLVGGAPAPTGTAACTSAFLIRLGSHLAGLSSGHCAGLTRSRRTLRRNAALRTSTPVGLALGGVQRNLWRKRSRARSRRLDALALPAPSGPGRFSAPVIDRGILGPPLFVTGSARPRLGREVCFAGRTSGTDRCGEIIESYPGTGGLPCTTITADFGDSGSPVYTPPAADGSVRAVGIATLVFGPFQSMCFTPIGPVLDALRAKLVTAPAS
ncbi:MAG: hypothetical protein QOI64_1320 [Solirubrobacteraceae bacterium]|nr:hypothetical protein [Solirubrobacteraceae bacterium]